MKLILKREQFRADGIFGRLQDENGGNIGFFTVEHAYLQDDGSYAPKVTTGTHTCVRGEHRLHNMTQDFTTFEITGVEGHTDLLFHWGNFNRDSEGCVLLGDAALFPPFVAEAMVTDSKATFAKFMRLTNGINSFTLEVV